MTVGVGVMFRLMLFHVNRVGFYVLNRMREDALIEESLNTFSTTDYII